MSDATPFGFGKFVPGFEFLQGLTKSSTGGIPHMPQLASWVAPTLSEEELEKRIEELKAVQFWLDQNSRALTATVQALEVQKMTLATLKGMNVHMTDVANAFKPRSSASAAPPAPPAPPAPLSEPAPLQPVAAEPAAPSSAAAETVKAASGASREAAKKSPAEGSGPGIVDPMQWWGSLTQQFQEIAAAALKDAAAQTPPGGKTKKAAASNPAAKKASARSKPAAKKAAARKTPKTPKRSS